MCETLASLLRSKKFFENKKAFKTKIDLQKFYSQEKNFFQLTSLYPIISLINISTYSELN